MNLYVLIMNRFRLHCDRVKVMVRAGMEDWSLSSKRRLSPRVHSINFN